MMDYLILAAEEPEAVETVAGIFVKGNTGPLFMMLGVLVITYIMIQRSRAGLAIPELRKLAGLEAISEAVGRCTEMGKPVHISGGINNVTDDQTIASYAVIGYTALLAARYDTQLINTNRRFLVYAINEEIIRQSYLEEGRPDAFNPDDVRFNSTFQFSYTTSVLAMMSRERPGANILYGGFAAEAMILIEQSALTDGVCIGATRNTYQIPFFVAGCDYALIGEEMYAGSAYLSREPVLLGTVVGQDIAKIIVFGLIILGFVLQQFVEENPLKLLIEL